MGDPTKKLTDELCSLLDEATILSISSDYDLRDPQEFAAARDVLITISKDVEAEEATGFNPSGLGVNDLVDINPSNEGSNAEATHGPESDVKSNDDLTSTTESSQPQSLISAASSKTSTTQESPDSFHVSVFDGLGDEEKERQLSAMFGSLKQLDVRLALQKSKGDASLAIDELLNLQWLEQTGQRPKGIDGFYVSDDDTVPGKKRKGRKKKKASRVSTPTPTPNLDATDASGEPQRNEEARNNEISFISNRLNISLSEATSIYERHRASLGAAIVEILDNYIAVGLSSSDAEEPPDIQMHADRVSWVPREYILPIFEISPTRQQALDVLDMLAEYFEKPAYLKYNVSYSLVASELEPVPVTPGSSTTPNVRQWQKSAVSRPPIIDLQHHLPVSFQTASTAASNIAASRNHSFTSAASAFRKGRSDPLYRQAAAFYSERAREQASSHRQARNVEAGYLVDRNSTKDMIDLHGLTVQDGVDIALDRVWRWWDGLGEERVRKAKEGFNIITGIGRHSSGGRSPLRAGVFKALLNDDWKLEVQTGSYLVTGRQR